MRMLKLPVPAYTYSNRNHRFELSACFVYSIAVRELPTVLNCSTAMGVLGDNLELLKVAMRAPAVVLINGTRTKAYSVSGEELESVPPMARDDKQILKHFEMTCVNLTSEMATYRLRADGILSLSWTGEVNCFTCYICPHLTTATLAKNLKIRANALRKTLRDRRVAVALGPGQVCVYSLETLLPKNKTSI
jgi:hypothetical protein